MATYTGTITNGSDDAQETSGTMSLTATSLNANATTQISGMRFSGVDVPRGSTVTAASLELYLISSSYDDPDVVIRGQAADDAPAFATTAGDITNRAKTAAAVSWQASALGIGAETTPDLAAVVQEVIDRPGWADGNALALFIQGASGGSLLRWASVESANAAAALTITYTPPGGAAARAMHRAQMGR